MPVLIRTHDVPVAAESLQAASPPGAALGSSYRAGATLAACACSHRHTCSRQVERKAPFCRRFFSASLHRELLFFTIVHLCGSTCTSVCTVNTPFAADDTSVDESLLLVVVVIFAKLAQTASLTHRLRDTAEPAPSGWPCWAPGRLRLTVQRVRGGHVRRQDMHVAWCNTTVDGTRQPYQVAPCLQEIIDKYTLTDVTVTQGRYLTLVGNAIAGFGRSPLGFSPASPKSSDT